MIRRLVKIAMTDADDVIEICLRGLKRFLTAVYERLSVYIVAKKIKHGIPLNKYRPRCKNCRFVGSGCWKGSVYKNPGKKIDVYHCSNHGWADTHLDSFPDGIFYFEEDNGLYRHISKADSPSFLKFYHETFSMKTNMFLDID